MYALSRILQLSYWNLLIGFLSSCVGDFGSFYKLLLFFPEYKN